MQNVLRQIKLIIYRLKRNYGVTVVLRQINSSSQNRSTGVLTVARTATTINRAILLPTRLQRDFTYDLSFIAANKNFTYGGLFDTNVRVLIIDAKDLPSGYTSSLDDYFVYSGEKYEIVSVEKCEGDTAVLFRIKQATNAGVPT